MTTKLLQINDLEKDKAALEDAAALLRAGRLVAIPTETVYGLAANALSPDASKAIYAAKGRPSDNPLIVHISAYEQLEPLIRQEAPQMAALAQRFWPGPLTVVLPKSDLVPPETSGGLDTVAVRMPSHPIARALITLAGVPLAAPSANRSGSPSPTCAAHCMHDLEGRVDAVVDGGPCGVGVESTVITLCTQPPRLLRPGAVTLEMLREVLPDIEIDPGVFAPLPENAVVSSPGMKYRHYAPKARVVLVRAAAAPFAEFLKRQEKPFGALCFEEDIGMVEKPYIVYGREKDGQSQAAALFGALRQADEYAWELVYVRIAPGEGVGQAVYNRLLRASGFSEITP